MNLAELVSLCLASPPDVEPDERFEVHHDYDVLSHVGISWRVMETSIGVLNTAGICLVCTDPEWRRRGLMTMLMHQAHHFAVTVGVHYAALFTDWPEIYESLGYQQTTTEHLMIAKLTSPQAGAPVVTNPRGTW